MQREREFVKVEARNAILKEEFELMCMDGISDVFVTLVAMRWLLSKTML